MTTTHTPTPWHSRSANGKAYVMAPCDKIAVVCTADFDLSTNPQRMRDDAAFIVRAVNAHEELVAILAPFIEIWSQGGVDYKERMEKYWGYDNLHKAKAALTLARGEKS